MRDSRENDRHSSWDSNERIVSGFTFKGLLGLVILLAIGNAIHYFFF